MLAVELQTLTVRKACSPHAVERAPSKGTHTEEVEAKPRGKKRTTAEVADNRESSRKQSAGEYREERMGWVEMEEMLSRKRKFKSLWTSRGAEPRSLNSCGSSSKKVQKPPDSHKQQAGLEGQASLELAPGRALTEGCGIFF